MFPRIPLPGLPFGLPTYGIMVAIGFLAALWLAEKLGRRAGFPEYLVQDTAVWACIAGLVGAKVALLVLHPPRSAGEAVESLFQGGVFYGGFAGAALATTWLCRRRGIDIHALGDALAAPLALGHGFGRLGCFLAGCCYGSACDAPWAVHYTDPRSIPYEAHVPPSLGLHPVQLYEAAGNFALAAMCLALFARRRFAGQVIWTYVVAYGAFRFTVEHWRGDVRGSIGPFSTSQAAGLAGVLAGLALLAFRARASRREQAAEPAGAP